MIPDLDVNVKLNVAVLNIDGQNCFTHPKGSLYVPGALHDVERASHMILDNRRYIKKIYSSFDVHSLMQIFHKLWWKHRDGHHPEPFTVISAQQIIDGEWIPQIEATWSLYYVQQLEAQEGFAHCIWPDHAIVGTWSFLMNETLSNAINVWQVEYGSMVAMETLNKGWNPGYEFFGIFQPQIYLPDDPYTHFNQAFAEKLNKHAMIYAFGEAESHCFGLSIKQLLNQANAGNETCQKLLFKMVVLTDCTSDIAGYEGAMQPAIQEAASRWGMRLMKHDEVDVLNDLNMVV